MRACDGGGCCGLVRALNAPQGDLTVGFSVCVFARAGRAEPNRESLALTVLADKVCELIKGCGEFRGLYEDRATWVDTGLPRSAKPGGPARSGCQWDGAPLFFRPASKGDAIGSFGERSCFGSVSDRTRRQS